MNDPAKWGHHMCAVTGFRVDPGSSPYQTRYRVVFQVDVENLTSSVAALTRLDAWGTLAQANSELAQYPRGNRTACFCPTHGINVFSPEQDWSIYRFCYFSLSEAEIQSLLFYFRLWFFGGIAAFVVGPLCMVVPIYIWVRTKCFKRPIPRCCDAGSYAALN